MTTMKNYYCKDCNKQLMKGSSNAERCWDCELIKRKHKSKPFPKCKDCNIILNLKNALRCRPCANIHLSKLKLGSKTSKKHKQSISKAMTKKWKNPEYKDRVVKNILKANQLFPNKCEKYVYKILKELFKKDYKYVGNGTLIINGFNPDFINCNGQKKIIEFYGDYWHKQQSYKIRDRKRLNSYKKLGYKTLIIWEHELEDIKKLKNKLVQFHKV